MSKPTRRLQIFIGLEADAALNELVEYNQETITRAIEAALIERQGRLPHHAVEDQPGAHSIWKPALRQSDGMTDRPVIPATTAAEVHTLLATGSERTDEQILADAQRKIEARRLADIQTDGEPSGFNDPARAQRKTARASRKAALSDTVSVAVQEKQRRVNKLPPESIPGKPEPFGEEVTNGGVNPDRIVIATSVDGGEYVEVPGAMDKLNGKYNPPETYCPHHRPKYCEPTCKHRVPIEVTER